MTFPRACTDSGDQTPVVKFLSRLQGVRAGSGGRYVALCPAHDDRSPSLSIASGRDGRVLIKCHAGCRPDEVLSALNLSWSDLFPIRTSGGGS